jgi:hypothetical protein
MTSPALMTLMVAPTLTTLLAAHGTLTAKL